MLARSRILILTAAFGDGHNSAARNLALALDAAGAETKVADPCLVGAPRLTRMLGHAYRLVTTHLPRVWLWIYRSAAGGSKNSQLLQTISLMITARFASRFSGM